MSRTDRARASNRSRDVAAARSTPLSNSCLLYTSLESIFYLRVTVAFGSHLCYNGVARRARSSFRCCTAVSYTHLDVYKRQSLLRDPVPIPADLLWTDDGKPGLKAEYFQGIELAGAPALVLSLIHIW